MGALSDDNVEFTTHENIEEMQMEEEFIPIEEG